MTEFINMVIYIFNNIDAIIKNSSYAFGLITFFLGILLGNYFHLLRDRRKEFNSVVEELRNRFLKDKGYPLVTTIEEYTIIDIRNGLKSRDRRPFDKAIVEYNKSIGSENQKGDGQGGFTFVDETKILHAIDNLLKYLKKRR